VIAPTAEAALEERVVALNRVQKVHKGGRTLRHSALVVVGDGRGLVGVGLGKASQVPDAIRKASDAARKSMARVPIFRTTIPHMVQAKYGAAKVILKPASPGTGVIAGGAVRHVVEAAGIKDILAKSLGSANKINIARATLKALQLLQTPFDAARRRGEKPQSFGLPLDGFSSDLQPALTASQEKTE
jgi:small subunit ribosomal protein S5